MRRRMLVAVVEADLSVREALPALLGELGYAAGAFSSAEELLLSAELERADCLMLGTDVTEASRLNLRLRLARLGREIPIIRMTAHADEAARWRVREGEAAGYLLKPFSDAALAHTLRAALKES